MVRNRFAQAARRTAGLWAKLPRGLGRAAFLKGDALDRRRSRCIHGDGVLKAVEDFVGGVLETGVGLVEFAGRLGGELAELITIGDVSESSKNKI